MLAFFSLVFKIMIAFEKGQGRPGDARGVCWEGPDAKMQKVSENLKSAVTKVESLGGGDNEDVSRVSFQALLKIFVCSKLTSYQSYFGILMYFPK